MRLLAEIVGISKRTLYCILTKNWTWQSIPRNGCGVYSQLNKNIAVLTLAAEYHSDNLMWRKIPRSLTAHMPYAIFLLSFNNVFGTSDFCRAQITQLRLYTHRLRLVLRFNRNQLNQSSWRLKLKLSMQLYKRVFLNKSEMMLSIHQVFLHIHFIEQYS